MYSENITKIELFKCTMKKNNIYMESQEKIRRILREETQMSTFIRRRINIIDGYFNDAIKDWKVNMCDFRHSSHLLEKLIYDTMENLYFIHFETEFDDDDSEWYKISVMVEKYLTEKYSDEINKFYHLQCG